MKITDPNLTFIQISYFLPTLPDVYSSRRPTLSFLQLSLHVRQLPSPQSRRQPCELSDNGKAETTSCLAIYNPNVYVKLRHRNKQGWYSLYSRDWWKVFALLCTKKFTREEYRKASYRRRKWVHRKPGCQRYSGIPITLNLSPPTVFTAIRTSQD